ncbi:unnamed protein product [Protopolystoma xenopodis]|uniref:Uncharacterized protein n=1 Tax=Protopolystoma xenopodis TaxID=117903 RepID=A0A448WJB2_9PLAT|nr:unnamed protein product [Protopolystoma xenopodis]
MLVFLKRLLHLGQTGLQPRFISAAKAIPTGTNTTRRRSLSFPSRLDVVEANRSSWRCCFVSFWSSVSESIGSIETTTLRACELAGLYPRASTALRSSSCRLSFWYRPESVMADLVRLRLVNRSGQGLPFYHFIE